MNKICTDIEQTKKLIELGISIETADMTVTDYPLQNGERFKFICNKLPNDVFPSITNGKSEKIPAWSLNALLDLMRKEKTSDSLYFNDIVINSNNYEVNYKDSWHYIKHTTTSKDSLIDAAFEMIVWLKENGKI